MISPFLASLDLSNGIEEIHPLSLNAGMFHMTNMSAPVANSEEDALNLLFLGPSTTYSVLHACHMFRTYHSDAVYTTFATMYHRQQM